MTKTEARALRSAAYLIAAAFDEKHGLKLASLSPEVFDSIQVLREELDQLKLLEPYKDEAGALAV